ncbi:hypothetical protein QQS21_002009 [Conoideocrella luteorostrata]|uniref:CHAT domain-containing protein n=1 Tax=Conoideocrella luteorostrata TaxID=1105319 RepID=A0AAJ0G1P6_9HYPO|nr:hypothetical protein QQS21_002009 [Conoideocrella luteorostrata]
MNNQQYLQQLRADADHVPDTPDAIPLPIRAYDTFKQSGNRGHIDEAVELARQSIKIHIGDAQSSFSPLNQLRIMLEERYQSAGEIADLEEAITVTRQLNSMTPSDHPNLPVRLINLAFKLSQLYEKTGEIADLEEAILFLRQAVDISPVDGHLVVGLNLLGRQLSRRFKRIGEISDLEEVIRVARHEVDLTPLDDHLHQVAGLRFLGNQLSRLYKQTGEISDLEEAIIVARQELDLMQADHVNRAGRLKNLGDWLESKYERTNNISNLEEAILVVKQAVDLTPCNHPGRASRLINLGNKLDRQYKHTGDVDDAEETVLVFRQVVDSTPIDDPSRATGLYNLGKQLNSRYMKTGEIVDLEEAIIVARQAIDLTPKDHPKRAGRLDNLGNQLEDHYHHTGRMADLEEAIGMARQAVSLTPANHPDQANRLNNLGTMLGVQYERKRNIADLKEAISVVRQAVSLTPADHPDQASWLNNLGSQLSRRYEQTGKLPDLEEAITVTRQAVNLTPADHPDRAARLHNLGHKLHLWPARRSEENGLKELIEAVNTMSADDPNRAVCLTNLGNQLTGWYGQMTDLEEACAYYLAAWSCQNATPLERVEAAARCLPQLAKQSKIDHAIQLGLAVLDLLPAVNTKLLDYSDQQFVMSTFAGVASNVCAYLLKAGRRSKALKSLERGHAVILGQLVDGRDDLSSLRLHHHDIAGRYDRLRDEINEPAGDPELCKDRTKSANRRREAVAELDACAREIRGIAGYERFLLGQTDTDMQACAMQGTIVVINVTEYRSDAIFVSQVAISTINLPRLLAADAKAWLGQQWTGRGVRRGERVQKNKDYLDYLAWLWDVCVQPVLEAVDREDHRSADVLPRIWWMGTGLGHSMPFHAAGVHTAGSTQNAPNKVVSSYTPSIKTLAYSHRRASIAKDTEGSLLIATMPTTPEADASDPDAGILGDISGVMSEEKLLKELVAGNMRVESLNLPSVSQVIDKLRDCSIAHFACHGTTDHVDPSNSGLILQRQDDQGLRRDRLTVHQVSKLRLDNAHIAYLSACSTAENRVKRLSDEVLHVVSGFQVAGFPHVVGCLWPSNDRICVEVAGKFYRTLFEHSSEATGWEGRDVANAVRKAVMAVRETALNAPLLWAQFVHFGA